MTQFFHNLALSVTALAFALTALPVVAQDQVKVPSGQVVILSEVLLDDAPGETWARFRFVAPQINTTEGDIDSDTAAADMDHLCQKLVLPYLKEYALNPARIVISLSDRAVPFGAATPGVTQFFESYHPEKNRCIWEGF